MPKRKAENHPARRHSSTCYILETWQPRKKPRLDSPPTPPPTPDRTRTRTPSPSPTHSCNPCNNTPNAQRRADPFRSLPYDCAGVILQHLDLCSLITCEAVSKGWQSFLYEWIAIDGLRIHFRSSWTQTSREDIKQAVKIFKQCAVCTVSFSRAQPSGARKIIADERFFTIAGDSAAWKAGDGIYWQDLRYQADGSFYPVQKVPLFLEDRVLGLLLSADGYLLVRTQSLPLGFRDQFFCLATGKEMWSRRGDINSLPWSHDSAADGPIAIGKEKVYYATSQTIFALNRQTGSLVYQAPLDDALSPYVWHEASTLFPLGEAQKTLSRKYTALLEIKGKEVIVGLVFGTDRYYDSIPRESGSYPRPAHGLRVVNGDDGRVLQTIPLGGRECKVSFMMTPANPAEEFCVVSIPGWPIALQMERYTVGKDGLFHHSGCEMLMEARESHFHEHEYCCAVDPYRQVFARTFGGLGPSLGRFTPVPIGWWWMEIIPAMKVPGGQIDVYYDEHSKELTLFAGRGGRELYAPYTNPGMPDYHWLHFVDGNRLVLEIARRILRPSWAQATRPIKTEREFFIFDFGYRPGGLRVDELEYQRMQYEG